ncbi:histidine kinase [Paractinoplanes ferrugineus]|uniref:histidine kinase n=1 Tax=Paractinoplanes ferrugineus TaxID=113564 RepID=A0A919MFJ3_9ACTN|nr:histidine kinase [Actinoplanes ferrugineus]
MTSLVAIGTGGAVLLARDDATRAAIDQVTGIAETVARSPAVIEAVRTPNPTPALQPYAESVRRATRTDFVVVMATDRTRWTHPTTTLIGQPFIGTVADALNGGRVVETHAGTLGESVRTVVPVRSASGRVIALVSVGITTEAINERLLERAPAVLVPTALALLLAAAGSGLLSRRLRRQTHGLGPAEMTRMYEYHDAVLHSVREGLIVADRTGRVTLVNDEARRLLNPAEPRDAADLRAAEPPPAEPRIPALPGEIGELLATRDVVADAPVLVGDRVLVANQRVIRSEGHTVGAVLTLRDHTELRELTGELDSVRGLTEALRAQAHEAANRLHTVLTLVELGRGDEAVRLATAELAVAQQLTDRVMGAVSEPALAALLLGKSAQAAERGVQLVVDEASRLGESGLAGRDLLTVVGNLVDNALEAVAGTPLPRQVTVLIVGTGGEVLVRVGDTGPGIADAAAAFRRGWTTKERGRGVGLSLVRQVIERYAGSHAVSAAPGGGTVVEVRLPVPA